MGLMGPKWSKGGAARAGCAPPPPLVRIGLGEGGGAHLSFSLSPSFSPPSRSRKEGSPTPTRRRTPPPGAPTRAGRPPPCSFIYGGRGAPPPLLVQFGPEGEGARGPSWLPLSLSTKAHKAHYFSRGVPVTLRHSGFLRNHPEHFRCPNIVVQYINLYVSIISRLLVMSVIISGTPNYLRYIKTQKLIIPIFTKL